MKLDYNVMAREYAEHRRVHPEVLQNLVEAGELKAASRVLELGCGTGNYTIAIEKITGCSCWGVDPSEQMLAKAKARPTQAHYGIGNAEGLDFPGEFFDLVFSVDVIHHVRDRAAYFREAYRVLNKGGKVCTVTDSEEIIRNRQPLSVYFPETVTVDLGRYPRISDLRAMILQVGFGGLKEMVAELFYSLTGIQEYRDKAFSCLHLIPATAFERGLQRMETDLSAGPIPGVSRYLLMWGTKGT